MASTTFSLAVARSQLDRNGFVDLEDGAMGDYVQQMERKGFPLVSDYGLAFCKERVLEDERIRTIIENVFERCTLAHYLRYKAYPGHIVSFVAGGPKAGRRSLLVQLWARGSQVEYYGGSHLHDMPKEKGDRLLWEIRPSTLAASDCVGTPKNFPDGGIVVLDSRLDYEMKTGYAITLQFALHDIVQDWPKLKVPNKQKVARMETDTIKINYELVEK